MTEFDSRLLEYSDFFTIVAVIVDILYVILIIETIFDLSTKRRLGWRQTIANISIEIGNRLLDNTVIGAIFIIGFFTAEEFAFAKIPVTWWSWVVAVAYTHMTLPTNCRVVSFAVAFVSVHIRTLPRVSYLSITINY